MRLINTLLNCLLFLLLLSCESNEKHISSNSKYVLEVITNNDDLSLSLFNSNFKLLDREKIGASDVMKWSVNWHNDSTIVLHSHDIGTYAWMVSSDKLLKSGLTNKMNLSSIDAFDNKYNVTSHLKNGLAPLIEYEMNTQ